jgi:hypothetical protein
MNVSMIQVLNFLILSTALRIRVFTCIFVHYLDYDIWKIINF